MEGDDRSRHVQMDREKEFELAILKRDEVIQQLSAQLQHLTAHNYSQEATQLAQQVQLLQTQLQHAGKVLQSQTEKQSQTSHALQDATQEIVSLQEVITEKDSMMSQLAERLDLITQEYTKLKESHESTKLREKQTNEVVQKLMMDAEQMRKQKSEVSNSNGISGSSSPTSPTPMINEAEVQAKMEALRSELEETYGLHFAQMKQAVVQQFQEEKVTLDAEVSQLKMALETATKENAEYQQQLQQYVTTDSDFGQLKEECNLYKSQCDQLKEHIVQIQAQSEDYCQRIKDYELTATGMKELQDECAMYKSQNDELKNKINSQQDSVVSLQSELDNLASENTQLRDQMNLLSQDLDSQNTEIEEAFLEKSQYIEKAKKLEQELAVLKSENDEIKSNSSKMEDMISSLKEALDQSEASRQKLEAAVQPKQSEARIRIDGVTSCESTDETDSVQVIEEPISGIDHMSIEVQPTLASSPAESEGQSAMCVQEEVTLENASLAYSDQAYNDSSLSVTKSLGVSAISLEQNISTHSPNDSEATLTNDSCNLVSNELTQSNLEQIHQHVAQIEALKGDVARLLDEKSFALSEIEKLSDEILVLKDIGNKAEVDLRELDHMKSENQFFQKEREEQLETNLTLMADVQNANLVIENLEKERTQLLADMEKLDEKSKEMTAKYEEVSVINQRLDSELTSLRQNQSNSVLSQMDSVNRTNENNSTGLSSHSEIDNASRISTCHSSLDQGQLPQYDSNNLAQFDGSFYFGRQEEVPLQTHEQSTDHSHSNMSQATNVNQSANNQSNNNSNVRPNKTDRHQDLEQEILQMQTHVDDLHSMRANLQEHIEHLRKEAKSLEESLLQKQHQQLPSESVRGEDNVTDIPIVNELQERNKTLQEEKDLLDRKVSALEWQVNELKSENKNNNQSDRLPVEEVMVQNVMEVEEAVQSQSPWTKPPTQSLSSQDSIEQEIMVQCSQNPSFLQEVVEEMVLQGTCETTTSSRMSPDSIDQEDTDDRVNDISSDSIEQDVSGPERRQLERVRNSQCMLSVNPMVPSYSGGAGNSTCSVENALDSASNVKSVGSADSNVDSVEQSKAKVVSEVDLTNSGDYSEGKQGCDSASQILAVLDDTSPGNNSTPEHLVLQQKYTKRLRDIEDLKSEIVILQNSLHELGEDYDTLRAENNTLSSAKEDSQRRISSLQNECDELHGKIQQMRTENSDLTSKNENLGKLQTELEKEKFVMEVQISELKENLERSEKEKSSMNEVESMLKSELETLKKGIAQESHVPSYVNDDVMIDLKSECSKLNLDVECLREENTSLKTDNEKLLTELESKEKERTKLAKSLEENKAKFIRNKAKLVKLEKTNTGKSSGDIQQLETLLQNKEQEKQELKEKMENVIIKMVNDNTTLKETLEITMEKLREEKTESEQMKDVVEGIMRTNSELLEQAKNNNTDIDNLKAERSLAENSIQVLEDQRAKYEKELEELTFSLDKERCNVSVLEAQCQDFQIMFEKVKDESSVREEKFATSVQSYQDLIDASKREVEELKQALNMERTTAGMLEKQCEDLRSDLENERSNVRILQSQYEDLKTELEMDESKLAKECKKFKSELDKERSNVEKMEKQFQDLNTNLEKEILQVGLLETQCKDLQMELEREKSNVGTLETQCKDLKSELEREKSNVGTLETQCKDLKSELEREKSNVGTLETQCKDLQTELEREKSNVGTLETQCEDLKSEVEIGVSNLNKYCEELKSELEKEKSNTRILETQIEDLKTETETNRSRLEKQCKDLKADLETERSNTVLLEKQCEDFSAKTSALQLQLIEQKECCKLVNSECEEQKEQYQQLWDTLEKERNTQENEILSLKSLMTQESENYYEREENFAQRFDAVSKELETLRIKDRNYEELQIKHNQVTSILEALHSQVERDAEVHKTEKLVMVHRMEQERKSFQSERQELVSKCEKLQDSLAGVEQNLDSLNLEYQTKFQDFCTEKDEFENDLESLRSELEETFNKEKTCLQEQYVKLEREKGIAEKQFSIEKQQLEESIQCLKHENTELAGENLTLKSNKQTLIEEKTYLEENLRKIESELDQQRQQDRLAQQTFESTKLNFETQMESTRRALETEIETLKKGKVELDQKIVEEVETKERLLKECESLQHYNNELVSKFKTFETESEKKMLEMKEESCFLCGQLEEIQLDLDETVRKHTEEKQSLENQCTELREEVNVKQNVVDELSVALNLAKSKCDELEKMHLEKNSQSQALFEKLESTNRENEDLVENFKQHVEDLEAEVKILHQQVQDSDKQNIEKEKSIESFQEEVTDLTESRDFYQAELTSTTEKLRLAGNARECLNTEIESLKQEVNDLKRNKHDLLSQVESLKNNMTENDSISEDFLSDLKSLTAERDGELTKNKELIHELKLRNERCEKLIIAREQLLKELNASEQLQAMLEKENEDIKKRNLTLIQECAALKELELQLKQDLKQRVNNEEKLREELKDLRQKLNDLEQEKSNISLDQGMLVNENLEDKNQALEQEISHLKENLAQIGEERDNLLNIHEAMAEDLSEMQHKYETVQSLMEDTKKECRKEIEKLQAQLGNVNSDMTAMKSSLELLEEDLNLSHDQKASLVLRLTREESRLQQTSPGSPDDSEDSYKSQKDMRNQRVASGTQRSPADIPVFMEDQQEQVSVSGFFQVEPHTDEDTVAQYEKNIEDLTRELENVKLENIQHQKSYQEEKAKLQRKIKDLEKIKNGDDQSSCDDRTSELVPQEADIETSYSEVAGLSAQEQEDKIEAIVEARITRRIEGMKYEMEEKVAFEIRSKEAEVADKYDKEFKKYKKEMEVYMKHKFETIRAEKDTAFLKAMQKVNKDADKRIKKEVERQRIKLLEERANEAGDGSSDSSGKVGSQIGDVVEKLHQENQDLAEARDALLQQVALSHHNQERLQEELRIMREDEDSIHSDFPDNIPGESVVSEGGDYIQESDNDISHAKFSRPTYDSTSVMLDWELSPQVSFDYGRDENDSLEFVEHFECRRPRCRLIRQKFQELFDALPGSAGTSVTGDTEEENFNSDDSDSETDSVILQKEAVSKEGSFHPEEARAGYVAMDSMDPKNVPISSEKSGFFLGNQKDNLDNNFLHHETEKPRTEIVLTPEAGVGFQPEEGFVNVSGTDVNIGCGARSEFLPEDERIVGGENVEDFIVDDVFESQIVPETMSRETDSQRMSIISGDDKEIIPESLAVCESKPLVDANRFQPEVEFHVESSPRTPGIDITEGFTREADEFENEDMFKAGDGFKPEKDDFSLEQDLVGDIMPITPTSELESELVREALRNAAQMVAPPYVAKTDICKAPVSEKVESRLAQKHQLVKRSKSAPSTEGFIEESDEAKEDKFIRSADCMTLTALHKDGNPLNESELLQGSSQQPKQNEMSSNQKHRSPTKTVATDSKTESEIIQRLRKDKKILEDKVASLLKEKQNLNDKQREITLQLENETLSRQHLEQELMGISDNFEKLPVSVAAKITKPEVLETDLLQSKLDIESQCKALQDEISSLETSICEKDELLKLERENFDGETKSLLLKIKDLEERLHSEEYNSIKSKTDSEQEITELRQRIAALTSVLEQDETKIDLDKQVDSLESQVKELVSDKNQLQHKCKELEGMLRETQMVALKEKTELDKELESIEGRTLMLSSANQDLKSKYVEMSNMQVDLMEEKKQLLEEKQALESHLNEVLLDNQSLQTTCNDLEGLVQKTKDASITMEDQLKLLEDNLCEITAAKQELHLQCMEQESRLRAYGRSSELKGLSWEQKGTQTENAVGEETDTALQESTNKIEGLEAQLKEKERYVHKLQKDLEKSLSSEKQKDFMQVKSGLEQTLREKDNYIKKLEEHFLRQGPLSIPTSGPSMLPVESESEETSSSGDSVAPHVVIENVEEHGLLQAHSTEANIGEDHSERQSDVELKIEDLADHSLVSESDLSHISVGNLSRVSVGDINELSTASAGMQSIPQDKNFGSKSISDKGPKLVAAISHSSPITSPRIFSPRAPSTCSNTGSFNSSERLHAGFITEEDGHLESKHSELVDEIARLRKDLSETQAIYTKENVLLKEALDKDGSSREATKSKSSVSSMSFDSDSSQEVTRLRQKVATLEETNKMLQIENERWLRRIQDQEQVVIELRELLGRDEPNSDQTDSVFGKQITLLQNQRDHLLEKIHDFEMKNQRLTRKLGDNSILEESLRREKDLLYAKLCEKEDLERELSEKRLALEKQRHSQEQLEEILYHKNITEKELMRQKRLLEEELTEIESKLQEKEELLERQKNTLLRDIKRRGSSPPKLLSGSFSVALNDDGSPASSTFYLEGTPSTSTPKKPEATASPRELGRLELQVQEAERQHANAIQTLRQSLGGNPESQQGDTRQRYRGLLTSLRKEHLHKVPES